MKKLLKFSSAAALAGAVLFSCKQEAVEKAVPAAIPADVLAAAEKWQKLEKTADPLFMKSLEHTDLGSEQFSFSKGNLFQGLYTSYKELIKNPDLQSEISKQANADKYIELIDQVMNDSGLLTWESSAFSSRQESASSFLTKSYVICEEGYSEKLLFSLLGGAEQDLSILNKMPANTAFAASGTLDTTKMIKYLDKLSTQYPEIMKEYSMKRSQAGMISGMMGVNIDELLAELNQPISLIVTLDAKEMMQLPDDIKINKPGILLSFGKPGAQMNALTELMKTQAKFEVSSEGETQFFTMPQAIPFLNSKGVVAVNENEFVFGSDKAIVQNYLGKQEAKSAELAALTQGFSSKGNGFVYLPKSTGDTLFSSLFKQIQEKPDFSDKDQKALNLIKSYQKDFFLTGIYSLAPHGITAQMRSSLNLSGGSGSLAAVSTIGVMSAMILPALGTARAKAQGKKVTNGLKQAGLGMHMYYSDGTETQIPKDYHTAFEWDLYNFSQPNRNFNPTSWDQIFGASSPYKFFLKPGISFNDIESSTYPLIAVPEMKSGDKLLVLYGDGHVSTQTVFDWKNMTNDELFQQLNN